MISRPSSPSAIICAPISTSNRAPSSLTTIDGLMDKRPSGRPSVTEVSSTTFGSVVPSSKNDADVASISATN